MNTKRISPPQLEKIRAALDLVAVSARAEVMQYTTIKSYRDWTRRFCFWLCLDAAPELRTVPPAEKIRGFLLYAASGGDNGKPKSATSIDQARHVDLLAGFVGRSSVTVTRILNGTRRRGPVWTKISPHLTTQEIALLDVAHSSTWNTKNIARRPSWPGTIRPTQEAA